MLPSKRIFSALGIFLMASMLLATLALPCRAMDIPAPTDRFYVNDFADLLSQETEDYIVAVNEELCSSSGAQVVVVTLPSLNGAALEEFSTALFRQYGIGSQELNNGVLLLVAVEEREFRIEVGYGLEGALNDAKTGRIQDTYIIPYLKDNKWDDGIVNGFNAVVQEVQAEYSTSSGVVRAPVEKAEPAWYETPDSVVMIAMLITVIVTFLTGKYDPSPLPLNVIWLILCYVYFRVTISSGWAFVGLFACGLAAIIGWAVGSPGDGSSYSGSSGRSHSSRSSSYSSHSSSHSSHSSSHSSHSGGGGRSGGGGSSRKF